MKPKVMIESPFRGSTPAIEIRNRNYLNACIRDSIQRGEVPLASHKLYTDSLLDSDPDERKLGIELGYEWWPLVDHFAFYTDYGISQGMEAALTRLRDKHMTNFSLREILHG